MEANQIPVVTVIVSVYNKVDIVERCIASILAIDYPRLENLIIDGYSTDGSYEVLKKIGDSIRLVQIRGNYATALNRAIEMVKTPLIALTDADCIVDKNWLRELVAGFDEGDDIRAVAGFVGTPAGLPLIGTLIGIEYEGRHKFFPRYLSRAPTMNLCVRTDAARLIKFDERLPVAVETDFGFRLSETGKILYRPQAVVYHYPRVTWRSFFMQQVGFAKGAALVYLRHRSRLCGDHISTFSMIWQIPLFVCACILLALAAVSLVSYKASLILFSVLFLIYARDMIKLPVRKKYYPALIAMLFTRTLGWTVGTLSGLLSYVLQRTHPAIPNCMEQR